MIRRIVMLLLLLCAGQASAIDPLPFADDAERVRFQHLVAELRCTVCQNQNLADSNATLAKDLRLKVFNLMQQGRSNAEIKQYLVDRYGDFVLYDPPVKPLTWALWFGPIGVVGIGVLLIVLAIRRRSRALPPDAAGVEDQA